MRFNEVKPIPQNNAGFYEPCCRRYRVFNYLPVDRVPDIEFGLWPQTMRRWMSEGMPEQAAAAVAAAGAGAVFERYFGYRDGGAPEDNRFCIPMAYDINPPFQDEVLEELADSRVVRQRNGVVCRQFRPDGPDSSIPHFIEFPVRNRADWLRMKERFRFDDPSRIMNAQTLSDINAAILEKRMISAYAPGFYGQLRNWVGVENLSCMFYDEPGLIRDMLEHWTGLVLHSLEQILAGTPLHEFDAWEDMCFNHGPLVSPAMFREFIIPCYERIGEAVRRHGCGLRVVDCDGKIDLLVEDWLAAGVNVMFPVEVAAGTDMYALRARYGPELRFCGGVDKRALAKGRDAIDRELERVAPMLEAGGYIPHVDHSVPPDVSLENFLYYRRRKCELIGKTNLSLGGLP